MINDDFILACQPKKRKEHDMKPIALLFIICAISISFFVMFEKMEQRQAQLETTVTELITLQQEQNDWLTWLSETTAETKVELTYLREQVK